MVHFSSSSLGKESAPSQEPGMSWKVCNQSTKSPLKFRLRVYYAHWPKCRIPRREPKYFRGQVTDGTKKMYIVGFDEQLKQLETPDAKGCQSNSANMRSNDLRTVVIWRSPNWLAKSPQHPWNLTILEPFNSKIYNKRLKSVYSCWKRPDVQLIQKILDETTDFDSIISPGSSVCNTYYKTQLLLIKQAKNLQTSNDDDLKLLISNIKSNMPSMDLVKMM